MTRARDVADLGVNAQDIQNAPADDVMDAK